MNKIKALLIKDVLELKTYKRSFLFLLVFYSFFIFFQGKDESSMYIGTIMIMMIFSMVPIATFGYDEKTNTSRYLNTLPLTKREMVLEKYLLTLICTVLGAFLGIIISALLITLSGGNLPDIREILLFMMGGLVGISIVDGIQITSIYKYGIEKGRIMLYIMIVAIIGILSLLSYILPKDISLPDFNISFILIVIAFLIILFIIYFIFYKLSYNIYKKKDA